MKPEEALERIKNPTGDYDYDLKAIDALVIQALEKQIPKKVMFSGEYLCRNCNSTINSEDCYCYNCGQRQDWSEEL